MCINLAMREGLSFPNKILLTLKYVVNHMLHIWECLR